MAREIVCIVFWLTVPHIHFPVLSVSLTYINSGICDFWYTFGKQVMVSRYGIHSVYLDDALHMVSEG